MVGLMGIMIGKNQRKLEGRMVYLEERFEANDDGGGI